MPKTTKSAQTSSSASNAKKAPARVSKSAKSKRRGRPFDHEMRPPKRGDSVRRIAKLSLIAEKARKARAIRKPGTDGGESSLTKRQRQVLDFMREEQSISGLIPSTREIQLAFGFASQTAVMNHLKALEKHGIIVRIAGRARGVVLPEFARRSTLVEIPVYGRIAAGLATDNSQERDGCISVDSETLGIPNNARTFALKVRGESMIGAHIMDGDTVVLEFREPNPGDIVAALVDGETTLKRYLLERGRPYLKAENPEYPNLIPARELVIQGVLVAVIRQVCAPKRRRAA